MLQEGGRWRARPQDRQGTLTLCNPNPNPILTLTQVMSYDLSDDQDFHECPTDQACTNPNTNP